MSSTTPLGFLPVNVDMHSHGMFLYREKDRRFYNAIAEYIKAGINVGELCNCCVAADTLAELKKRIARLKFDTDQVRIVAGEDFIRSDGAFDFTAYGDYITESINIASQKFNGMRSFSERHILASNRKDRYKWLEAEAFFNVDLSLNLMLCGYNTSLFPRSYLLQAKSLHNFTASWRSMRSNKTFISSEAFFSKFYQFKQISKIYSTDEKGLKSAIDQFEEVAVRTPLGYKEILDMKKVVEDTFSELANTEIDGCEIQTSHVHMAIGAEQTMFSVIFKMHDKMEYGKRLNITEGNDIDIEPPDDPAQIIRTDRLNSNGDLLIGLAKCYEFHTSDWIQSILCGK